MSQICEVCGKPVEEDVHVLTDGTKVSWPIVHDCELRQRAAAMSADRQAVRMRQCYGDSELLETYGSCSMAGVSAPAKVTQAAEQLIEDIASKTKRQRRGLLLFGDVGVGKSYLAAAVCNEVIVGGGTACWVKLEQLIRKGSQAMDLELKRISAKRVDLVVIDDFASERDSSFGVASVFSIVDRLYEANSTMLVTTNLTRSQLGNPATPEARRVLDRIKQRCKCVEYIGPNKRQEALAG